MQGETGGARWGMRRAGVRPATAGTAVGAAAGSSGPRAWQKPTDDREHRHRHGPGAAGQWRRLRTGLIGGSIGALAVERDWCLSWVVACRVCLVPLCGLAVAQVGGVMDLPAKPPARAA